MPKNIVLLSDGTGNSLNSTSLTNVTKLYLALRDLQTPSEQMVFYDAGIGTEGDILTRSIAQLTGVGIKQNIIQLYIALVLHYEPGDRLYLLGFSRGATTVRSLAGMIRKIGIIRPEYVNDKVDTAYDLYNSRTIDVDGSKAVVFRKNYSYFDKREGRATVAYNVAIAFLGVYDTVEALGFPGFTGSRNLWFGFHDLRLSRMIKVARHALALDEHRVDFAPTLWIPHRHTDSEQRWFPGAHSDIGGGYQHHELADGAYIWMMTEAQKTGLILPANFLEVDCTPIYVADDALSDDGSAEEKRHERQLTIHPSYLGKLHDSRFFIRSNYVREPGMISKRRCDECVDETVLLRKKDPRKHHYTPKYFAITGEGSVKYVNAGSRASFSEGAVIIDASEGFFGFRT